MNHIKLWQSSELKVVGGCKTTQGDIMFAILYSLLGQWLLLETALEEDLVWSNTATLTFLE